MLLCHSSPRRGGAGKGNAAQGRAVADHHDRRQRVSGLRLAVATTATGSADRLGVPTSKKEVVHVSADACGASPPEPQVGASEGVPHTSNHIQRTLSPLTQQQRHHHHQQQHHHHARSTEGRASKVGDHRHGLEGLVGPPVREPTDEGVQLGEVFSAWELD